MSEWKEILLGEFINVVNGYAFKSSDFLEERKGNALPVIKIKNVANGDVHVNGCQFHFYDDALSKFIISKGDILLALTGNHPEIMTQVVGEVSRYKLNESGFLNQRVAKILSKNENDLNNDYLYYFLKDDNTHDYLASQSTGSANQANISKGDIENIPINLPSISEQISIAEILSCLDDKIDLLHRQNNTLEQLAETLFRQWFVEEADDNWESFKFHEIVKHVKPGTNFQPKRIEKGIPFLNVRNLSKGFLDYSDISYISDDEYKRVHKNWIPEENDVLISRIGTLGVVAVISKNDLPVAVHYNMINLKAKATSFQFLYFLLKSNSFQEKYRSIIRQSVQEYVAIEDVENIELSLPIGRESFREQEQSFIEIFTKILSNKNQAFTLTKLRDTLLPKLMSGEASIKN